MKLKDYTREQLIDMLISISKKMNYWIDEESINKIEFIEVVECGSNCNYAIILKDVDDGAINKTCGSLFTSGNTCMGRSDRFNRVCVNLFGRTPNISFQFVLSCIQFLNISCRTDGYNLLSNWFSFLYE
jgi:hypothetical protein